MNRPLLAALLLLLSSAARPAQNSPGCKEAREFERLLEVYGDETMTRQMSFVRRTACAGGYGDGDTIKYSNGQDATLWAGRAGSTWYYPNGKTITSWSNQVDATWYWPNGQQATAWAYKLGATWYYPDGQTITHYAGERQSYYFRNGSEAVSRAPEFKTPGGKLAVIPFLEYVRDLSL